MSPPPPCLQGLFIKEHETQTEKNIVVEMNQNIGKVVVQNDSQEHKGNRISAFDKYIGLNACVDATMLCLLSCFLLFFVKITLDIGGIVLLSNFLFYKPWDPGISFHSSCITRPLCFKQWDPGISL